MSRSFPAIVQDQLIPVIGPDQARLISNIALIVSETMGEHLPALEDHLVVPAVAATLGYLMHQSQQAKIERQQMIDSGVDIMPSLYPGHQQVLEILTAALAADPRPDHDPGAAYLRKQMAAMMGATRQGTSIQ